MKIAFITMDNREHLKDYSCPEPYFGTAPEALLKGFSMIPEAEVDVISCVRRPVLAPVRIAPNIRYHALLVPKSGWMSTFYRGCIRSIRRKLSEIQPDIVHGQGTERYCAISAAFSGFPNVITIHGNMRLIAKLTKPRPFSFNWLNARLEAFTIPKADGVVCITDYTRRAVQGLARKTWVVPNAVDPLFITWGEERMTEVKKPSAGRNGAVPVILCVANVDMRKNQNAFIRSLDRLAGQVPFQIRFFGHCGDTSYAREFRMLVSARPWCRYGGMIGRKELAREFGEADALVLPTTEDNCPMVVLEAQAAGLPVIASAVGGVPELVEEGVTGLLADPHDPESMSGAVGRILAEPGLRESLASAARESALLRYHPRVVAEQHMGIYRDVLTSHHEAR